MNLTRLMTDKAWIEGANGQRHGPYKTKFGGLSILMFQPELAVSEGERIIQSLPDGSEQCYRVEAVTSNAQRGHIPAHISIRIVKDDAQASASAANANADVQPGLEETRGISSALATLSRAIDGATVAEDQKNDARRLLQSLTDTAVIKGLLGNPATQS